MAISKLKPGKNDGNGLLSSDHFKCAGADLSVHAAMLLNALVIHGCIPADLVTSTIIPIPKGRGVNITDSANYRGITLSSIYGKLLDQIVLSKFADKLVTSDLQFGFKKQRSTNMCTMILKETLAYYSNADGVAFCTLLDATKAVSYTHLTLPTNREV